jgi:hypothetical protein
MSNIDKAIKNTVAISILSEKLVAHHKELNDAVIKLKKDGINVRAKMKETETGYDIASNILNDIAIKHSSQLKDLFIVLYVLDYDMEFVIKEANAIVEEYREIYKPVEDVISSIIIYDELYGLLEDKIKFYKEKLK